MVRNPFYVCLDLFLGFENYRDNIVLFWLELCFDSVKNLSRDHHFFVVFLVLSVRSFKYKIMGGTSGGYCLLLVLCPFVFV